MRTPAVSLLMRVAPLSLQTYSSSRPHQTAYLENLDSKHYYSYQRTNIG